MERTAGPNCNECGSVRMLKSRFLTTRICAYFCRRFAIRSNCHLARSSVVKRMARTIRLSGAMMIMSDEQEYHFTIYHNGAHFETPVRGKKRFLLEREFLDDLV